MRRIAVVAFLSASLAVFPSAFAQRGGQPGGFGPGHLAVGPGRIAGPAPAHVGGGFVRPQGFAPRNFSSAPTFVSTAPNFVSTAPSFVSTAPAHAFVPLNHVPFAASGAGWRDQGRSWQDHHGDRDRDRNRNHDRSGYGAYGYGGYPHAYASSWTLLPWDLGTSDSTDYTDDAGYAAQTQQPAASVPPPGDGYRPEYTGSSDESSAYAPPPQQTQPPATAAVAPEPALTLIFNDGHREDIHNYVLTANTVIVLDEAASGRQKRIPLASINLPATEQAAQDQGLDFTPPA